jgi:hypothetical protein
MVEQRAGAQQKGHGERGGQRGPVDQRDPLLGAELIGLGASLGERVPGGHDSCVRVDEPVAHQRREQMGQRNDLAGGAADPAGHDRVEPVVQPVGDEPAEGGADAGVAAQEPGQPQQHRTAHDRL